MPELVQLLTTAALTAGPGRTVSGLIVPFNTPTRDYRGFQYDATSLRWAADVTRIPLLFQHDQNQALGHAVSLERTDAGIVGTFTVDDSPAGNRALAEVQASSRTGFSVGVIPDPDSVDEWWNAEPGTVTTLRGELIETSHVSIPAFDDARIDQFSTGEQPAPDSSAGLAGETLERSTTVPVHHAQASATLVTADLSAPPAPAPAAATSAPTPPPGDVAAAPAPAPAAAPPALAGAAQVLAEPDVYGPGSEHSFVRDAFRARLEGNFDAQTRLNRFNAQLVAAAAATRGDFGSIIPPGYRGEMLIPAIDTGRPIVSRLGGSRITLSDATPFTIPSEGEFDGVGDHVEGTAHVAAGTLTVGDLTVTPKAKSGAFEISRELVDSSNPAIDRIALNAMLRDYRTSTEQYAADTFATAAPAALAGGAALEGALIDYLDDRSHADTFIVAGVTAFKNIAKEEAGDGRPRYPRINPTNANGTRAGTPGGLVLDMLGLEYARTGSVAAGNATIVVPEDVLWGESSVLTFRFDEVLGPGVIKLALWAYVAAAKLRAAGTLTWTVNAKA